MLEKFAEDDRIEQMNAQKRRMRQLEHKRAVERLIEERREQNQRDRVMFYWILIFIRLVVLFYKDTVTLDDAMKRNAIGLLSLLALNYIIYCVTPFLKK